MPQPTTYEGLLAETLTRLTGVRWSPAEGNPLSRSAAGPQLRSPYTYESADIEALLAQLKEQGISTAALIGRDGQGALTIMAKDYQATAETLTQNGLIPSARMAEVSPVAVAMKPTEPELAVSGFDRNAEDAAAEKLRRNTGGGWAQTIDSMYGSKEPKFQGLFPTDAQAQAVCEALKKQGIEATIVRRPNPVVVAPPGQGPLPRFREFVEIVKTPQNLTAIEGMKAGVTAVLVEEAARANAAPAPGVTQIDVRARDIKPLVTQQLTRALGGEWQIREGSATGKAPGMQARGIFSSAAERDAAYFKLKDAGVPAQPILTGEGKPAIAIPESQENYARVLENVKVSGATVPSAVLSSSPLRESSSATAFSRDGTITTIAGRLGDYVDGDWMPAVGSRNSPLPGEQIRGTFPTEAAREAAFKKLESHNIAAQRIDIDPPPDLPNGRVQHDLAIMPKEFPALQRLGISEGLAGNRVAGVVEDAPKAGGRWQAPIVAEAGEDAAKAAGGWGKLKGLLGRGGKILGGAAALVTVAAVAEAAEKKQTGETIARASGLVVPLPVVGALAEEATRIALRAGGVPGVAPSMIEQNINPQNRQAGLYAESLTNSIQANFKLLKEKAPIESQLSTDISTLSAHLNSPVEWFKPEVRERELAQVQEMNGRVLAYLKSPQGTQARASLPDAEEYINRLNALNSMVDLARKTPSNDLFGVLPPDASGQTVVMLPKPDPSTLPGVKFRY